MWVAFRSWKGQDKEFSPRASRRSTALLTFGVWLSDPWDGRMATDL